MKARGNMAISIRVNGSVKSIEVDPTMPLLWVLRDVLSLKGAKFGYGIGQCGACTVHVDGTAVRSCLLPLEAAEGADITTIEGIASGTALHPVQQAWIDEDVSQCGYCQAGQIMQAINLLNNQPAPRPEEIEQTMRGNLCRCGSYARIKKAIVRAAGGGQDE